MALPTTGLVADWDPALIVGLNDGDACGTLPEAQAGKDAVSTLTARPLYKTAGPNGKPYLQFDGSDDFLESVAMTALPQPFTVFVVFRPTRWVLGNRIVDGQAVNATVISQYPADLAANKGIQQYSLYSGSAFTPTNPGGALTATGGQFGLVRALYDGASSALSVNRNTSVVGNSGTSSFTGICFGSAGNQTLFSKLDLVRAVVYDSTLVSASEVEDFLVSEYSLEVPRFILCDGDSLTSGTGSTGGNTYPEQLRVLLGSSWSMIETGVAGQTVIQMESDAATQVDGQLNTASPQKVLCAWGGTNDLAVGGSSAAVAYANYAAYCLARRTAGWKVVAMTILPRAAAGISATFETDRQTVNASIRSNWRSFANAIADVGGSALIGDAGDNDNITYYDADDIHLNNAGYAIVAGLVKAAIESIENVAPVPFVITAPMVVSFQAGGGSGVNNLAIFPRAILWDNPGAAGHKVAIKESATGSTLFEATASAQYARQYVRLDRGVKWLDFIVTQLDSGQLYIWY
ncbi:MAG: SGNH/GDSL hydrolase family protein [Pyrinomonadaceae bacterium]|nr:SGNH/GDSL hydrolase family protein [Pyrinomonadaceae bacterium]